MKRLRTEWMHLGQKEAMGEAYPHVARVTRARFPDPEYRPGLEFEFGLDLILDRLDEMYAAEADSP